MAWEYTFPEIQYEDWVEQVKKDLKGKSIDSVSSLWWPGESLEPIRTQDPDLTVECRLPDSWFSSPPLISEWIETKDRSPADINRIALDALKYGAQRIITPTYDASLQDIQQWMTDVYLDMIEWELHARDPDSRRLEELLSIKTRVSIPFIAEDEERKSEVEKSEVMPDTLLIQLHHEGNWVLAGQAFFAKITDEILHLVTVEQQKQWMSRIRFWVEMPPDYFKGVLMLRSLHFAWLNVCGSLFGDTYMATSPVIAVMTRSGQEQEDRFMIRAASSSLAASLSGAREIMIRVESTSPQQPMYTRVARNIHHLLHLESGLPKNEDPLAGAYALDYYTRKWTEALLR